MSLKVTGQLDIERLTAYRPFVLGPPPIPSKAKRRRGSIFLRLANQIATLMAIFGIFAWYAGWRIANALAIRREKAAIRQAGDPVDLGDLARRYREVPDSENAAIPLLDLWESESPQFRHSFFFGRQDLPKPPKVEPDINQQAKELEKRMIAGRLPWSPAERIEWEAILKSEASHMDAVRASLQRPLCRFPIQWEMGYDTPLPHLARIVQEARLFSIQAALETDRGDSGAALSALETVGQIGLLVSAEPSLVSLLIRMKCAELQIQGLERLLNQNRLSEEHLIRVESILAQSDCGKCLQFAYKGERAMMAVLFDLSASELASFINRKRVADDERPSGEAALIASLLYMKASGIRDSDRRFMLEIMREVIDLTGRGTPKSHIEAVKLIHGIKERDAKAPRNILSRNLLPSMGDAVGRFVENEARRRVALLAVAVERHQRDKGGEPPATLADLTEPGRSPLRADPFDGKPLRFRKLSQGYVVYSVGLDLVDNAGRRKSPGSTNLVGHDVTFSVDR